MRFTSGATAAYIHFVALSTSDHVARVTGLTSFNVYAAATSASTGSTYGVTVSEVNSTQMPGVYRLQLADSTLMTVGSGFDNREIAIHITSSMDPVTRVIEVYRPKITAGETLSVVSGVADVTVLSISTLAVNSITTALTAQLTSVESDVDSILTKVTSVDSRLSSMDTMLSSVNAKVSSIDTDIDTALTRLTSINAETTALIVLATSINTRVNAIQAQTTQLAFTQAGKVDANVHYINDVQVQGTGTTTDTWRPV